jgi:photosystem II stability/assembly factor-like uncharacterized protein
MPSRLPAAAAAVFLLLFSAGAVARVSAAPAKTSPAAISLQPLHFRDLTFRALGPPNMGGRISDLAVVEKHPATWYLATGTGGLFKTTNDGTTWSAVFEHQPVASIGAVAVWQRNPDVVWVGTGEANSRNSSSWGNGVYRSTDGGGTWTHVGLDATHNIGRVVLDPTDSATVYVAALGRLWGENPERGVYKTTDAGATWQQVLKVDARTGAVDLVMDPQDPKVLYAAMYARRRTPWSYESGGTTGGIFKTTDGGRTWHRLAGGLPPVTGRIGLDVYRRDPSIVMAVVESDEGGHLESSEDQSRTGGVFRSEDGGAHWTRVAPWTPRPFYFSQLRIQPTDSSRVYLCGFDLWVSDDGGRTFRARGARNLHPDLHALWIDPADGDHLILGTDGGAYVSRDRTRNWNFVNNLAIGEFYTVATDMRVPYNVLGGLQDNQSWMGPSRGRFRIQSWTDDLGDAGITSADWASFGGGDGFYVAADPESSFVYWESQGGSISRLDLASGRVISCQPAAKEGSQRFRFNWNTPFQISPHDPGALWMGGNHVFRLTHHGERWEIASPDLTTQNPARMASTGSAAEAYCTITTLQESARQKGVVWAGTDDGKLWVTRDGGANWADVSANLRGVPKGLYVSRVEASHHEPGTAYVCVDGHRTNDFGVYVLRTRDFGRTWTSIASDLPRNGPVKVVREDPVNPSLLYAGTEFGLFVSLDGGAHWFKPGDGLPTVAVDDLHVHPREHDLLIATHGRGLFVLDDAGALEHWTPAALRDSATLFPPRTARAYLLRHQSGYWGQRDWLGKNPPFGAPLDYFVKEWTGDGVSLTITDASGHAVRTLSGPGTPGFHRVMWDLQAGDPRDRIGRSDLEGPVFVAAGRYTVKMAYGKAPAQKHTFDVEVPAALAAPAP